MQDTIINFYSTSDDYGDFSNFAAGPSRLTGKLAYLRTLFSGTKFLDEKYREEIRRVSSLWSPHAWGAIVLSLCVKLGVGQRTGDAKSTSR